MNPLLVAHRRGVVSSMFYRSKLLFHYEDDLLQNRNKTHLLCKMEK